MSNTQQTLAQMVRSKYPGAYQDMDDVTLEKNVLAKHPEYSDLPRTQAGMSTGDKAKLLLRATDPTGLSQIGAAQGAIGDWASNQVAKNRAENQAAIAAGKEPPHSEIVNSFLSMLGSGGKLGKEATDPVNMAAGGGVALANTNPITGVPVDAAIAAHGAYGVATNAKAALAGNPEAAQNALLSGAEAVGGAAGTVGQVKAFPTTTHAGQALQEVKATAGDVPIDMTKPGNTALELYEQSQRGASLPKVVRDFVKRATAPGSDPITYEEAKDFQSNVSQLSADERMALKPNTKRLLGQLNADLKSSLEDAADTQGKGEQFTDAMQEYHNAMKIRGLTDEAKAALVKAALTSAGLYGLKKFWDAVQ